MHYMLNNESSEDRVNIDGVKLPWPRLERQRGAKLAFCLYFLKSLAEKYPGFEFFLDHESKLCFKRMQGRGMRTDVSTLNNQDLLGDLRDFLMEDLILHPPAAIDPTVPSSQAIEEQLAMIGGRYHASYAWLISIVKWEDCNAPLVGAAKTAAIKQGEEEEWRTLFDWLEREWESASGPGVKDHVLQYHSFREEMKKHNIRDGDCLRDRMRMWALRQAERRKSSAKQPKKQEVLGG